MLNTVERALESARRDLWHVEHPKGRVLLRQKAINRAFVKGRVAALTTLVSDLRAAQERLADDATNQHNDHLIHEPDECALCAVLAGVGVTTEQLEAAGITKVTA